MKTLNLIFLAILLALVSFYGGSLWNQRKATAINSTAPKNSFNVVKSTRPELKFFVMSFCPYGNQMEDTLRPVFDLLGSKADIRPQYIFDKIPGSLREYCANRSGDPNLCETYVQNSQGQLKNITECKQLIANNIKTCNDESKYLKIGNNYYTSLHGRAEANQDVREICAWNQTEDKKKWWNFVGLVNKNCTAANADTCWEEQGKKAELDTIKITECFNQDAGKLIDAEIQLSEKYQVQASPTVLINEEIFPPSSAYAQDGSGSLKIGTKTANQNKYRTPNVIKEAVCAAFTKAPEECQTILNELSGQAPAAGGCGN